jgi:hypothetical protein
MRALAAELYRRNKLLASIGALFAILAGALTVAMLFDHRQLLGENVWIKPIKFLVSVALYLWTLAWFLAYLERPRRLLQTIAWATAGLMVIELACIIFQAARGHTSHYNDATPLDAAIFNTMGALIFINTGLDATLLLLFLLPRAAVGRSELPPPYLWGIRLGLVSTLFSAAIGMQMIADGRHSVGVPDGGPGLPLVHWSTQGGDLRAAHAVTLHGLQLIPLVGWLVARGSRAAPQTQMARFVAVVIVFAAIAFWTWWQAIRARPLLSNRGLAESPPIARK